MQIERSLGKGTVVPKASAVSKRQEPICFQPQDQKPVFLQGAEFHLGCVRKCQDRQKLKLCPEAFGVGTGFTRVPLSNAFCTCFKSKSCLVFSNSLLFVFFIILGTCHTNNISFPNAIKMMPLKLKNLPAIWLLLEPQPTCRYGRACCKYNLSLSFPGIYPCFTKTIHTDPQLVT